MKIHTGYEKPRIILGRGLFDKSLFKNTLLDGEMIKTTENKWVFIINDIIAYEGNKMDNVILPERLKIVYNILETKYTPDEICDVCSYKVKNYYYLSKKSLNEWLIGISLSFIFSFLSTRIGLAWGNWMKKVQR
jgi:hypothetical protein